MIYTKANKYITNITYFNALWEKIELKCLQIWAIPMYSVHPLETFLSCNKRYDNQHFLLSTRFHRNIHIWILLLPHFPWYNSSILYIAQKSLKGAFTSSHFKKIDTAFPNENKLVFRKISCCCSKVTNLV